MEERAKMKNFEFIYAMQLIGEIIAVEESRSPDALKWCFSSKDSEELKERLAFVKAANYEIIKSKILELYL